MDFDLVFVMDHGADFESGKPTELLQNSENSSKALLMKQLQETHAEELSQTIG